MKGIRYRKPSMKSALGVTKVKRQISSATGLPTTKSGRQRKAANALTGGGYSKYTNTRAKINRPSNTAKHPPTPMGCTVWLIGCIALIALMAFLIL